MGLGGRRSVKGSTAGQSGVWSLRDSCPGVEPNRVTRLLWAPGSCWCCGPHACHMLGGGGPLWRPEKRVKVRGNWGFRQGALNARPQGVVTSLRKSNRGGARGKQAGVGRGAGRPVCKQPGSGSRLE